MVRNIPGNPTREQIQHATLVSIFAYLAIESQIQANRMLEKLPGTPDVEDEIE